MKLEENWWETQQEQIRGKETGEVKLNRRHMR